MTQRPPVGPDWPRRPMVTDYLGTIAILGMLAWTVWSWF